MAHQGSVTSSAELLDRARAGDGAALDALVEAYLPRLRRWATGRLPAGARDMLDTDDIVQDTVVAAVRNLDHVEVRGAGALQAYLRRALTNRLTDLYRRQTRRPRAGELDSNLPALGPSPLEEAVGQEVLERYEAGLGRLSVGDRELVILRIELRCGYEEIAASTGKSSAAHARVAVGRAIARLAREMDRGTRRPD
jgi:RNA polymerase sigma-70 factor, ECF subfamily